MDEVTSDTLAAVTTENLSNFVWISNLTNQTDFQLTVRWGIL